MARTKQIKTTTKTTKTTMTLEQFQVINDAIKDTEDFSPYSSETLLQYHLWNLYIKMSTQPDLDLNDFLNDLPLNPQATELPAPSEKKKSTKQVPTDELIIARARYKAMYGKAPGRMKLENIYNKMDTEDPIDSYNEDEFNQGIPDLLKKHQDKSSKKGSSSPKKSSPKKISPKASPTKKKSSSIDPMLKKNPDLDEHLKTVRQKYYTIYGKWPHGKMKIPTLMKKLDEALADMVPVHPTQDPDPQDEEIAAQTVDQDLNLDDTTYEKIIYQGVEYTHDAKTGQVFNENHELVAHKDEHDAFIWVDDKFHQFHTLDDDYEAPEHLNDGSETEEE